jgi:chromate transporter
MHPKPLYSLPALIKYFLKLGSTGFGGPVALVGYMHKNAGRINKVLISHKKFFNDVL